MNKKLFRNILKSILGVSFVLTAACQSSDEYLDTDNVAVNEALTKSYADWHKRVLYAKHAIDENHTVIPKAYDFVIDYNQKNMSRNWMNEVASSMAKNVKYKKAILVAAKDNKIKFAKALLNAPKDAIYYEGSVSALIDGLNHIEALDNIYRNLVHAYEDYARGRQKSTFSELKTISEISVNLYASKTQTPSVAEQLLAIAAIRILGLTADPNITKLLDSVEKSRPIESCLLRAKQNSAQCKAASHDKHDLSFCMAKHAIGETSKCFSWMLP